MKKFFIEANSGSVTSPASCSTNFCVEQVQEGNLFVQLFILVEQVEFYYKQFPENMRSLAGSLFFFGLALSSYFSSLLITIIHRLTVGCVFYFSWVLVFLNNCCTCYKSYFTQNSPYDTLNLFVLSFDVSIIRDVEPFVCETLLC